MKTINFTSNGVAISDFRISEWVDDMLSSSQNEFEVSTHLVIDELRARIKEGTIHPDLIQVMVEDEYGDLCSFDIDKNGRSHDWVSTQEVYSRIISRLL